MINESNYFYIFSFPRSGNTWTVNSLKDYLHAQRAELVPSVYGGKQINFYKNIDIKYADQYNPQKITGIKSHMNLDEFNTREMPQKKIIYIYRDPRDVMVSYYFYLNKFLNKNSSIEFDDMLFEDHLKKYLPQLAKHLEDWLHTYNGQLMGVKYESLQNNYINTLKQIRDFLDVPSFKDESKVKEIYKDNFKGADGHKNNILVGDNSSFYRKGIVGDWKNYFNDNHKDVFKEKFNYILIKFNYESSLNW